MYAGCVPSQIITDLGVTATTYASFAEIMTGFSFAALAVYLAYEMATGMHSNEPKTSYIRIPYKEHRRPIKDENGQNLNPIEVGKRYQVGRAEVAVTLFFAMASLAISSFLYASLTTQVENPNRVAVALLLYGVIFGASVLAFFYALTLMTYLNESTWDAARFAYWVVVIAGPAVVMRFLADAGQGAWNLRLYPSTCAQEDPTPPLVVGIAALFILLLSSGIITISHIFEKERRLYSICNRLCVRPILPAMIIFVSAVGLVLAGWLITEPVNYVPSEYIIWLSLTLGFLLLAFFALACGCVIGPRLSARKQEASVSEPVS